MKNKYIEQMRKQYPEYTEDKVDDLTLAKAYRNKHYEDIDENTFLTTIGLPNPYPEEKKEEIIESYKDTSPDSWTDKIANDFNNLTSMFDKEQKLTKPVEEMTYKEKFDNGILKYKDTNSLEKVSNDFKTVAYGTGEDFVSQEFTLDDNIVQPFKQAVKDVATDDYKSNMVLILGDDANDPKKVEEYNKKMDELNSLVPTHEMQKALMSMETKKGTAKNNVDTFLDAIKKEGVLSLDTWAEFAKAVPGVVSGSIPYTAAFVANLPQAIKGYAYKLAKDSNEDDGIKREVTREDYFKAAPVAVVIGGLDKLGFTKLAEPLKKELAKEVLKDTSKSISQVVKDFSKNTLKGAKTETGTEIVQENLETAYVKDENLTGEDIIKSTVGAVMGATGMSTGMAGITEVAQAVKPKETKDKILSEAIQEEVSKYDLAPNDGIYTGAKNQGTVSDTAQVIKPTVQEDIKAGFESLQEEIENDKPIEKMIEEEIEVKQNESDITPNNTIMQNEETEVSNEDATVPVQEPIAQEEQPTNTINEQENEEVSKNSLDAQSILDSYTKEATGVKTNFPDALSTAKGYKQKAELWDKAINEFDTLPDSAKDEAVLQEMERYKAYAESKYKQNAEDLPKEWLKENTKQETTTTNEQDNKLISTQRQEQLNELVKFENIGLNGAKKQNDKTWEATAQNKIDYLQSDEFKQIILDIDSDQEVMFKKRGKKVATRGKLFDLPFGFKGVVVYDKKGGGEIYEYSTSSFAGNFGKNTGVKTDLEAILRARENFLNKGEDEIKQRVGTKGAEIINPNIVHAKKRTPSNEIKKGQEEFETITNDGKIKKEFGYPIKLEHDVNAFVRQDKKEWIVTESNTGMKLADGATKTKAIEEANYVLEKVGPIKIKESIEFNKKNFQKIKIKDKAKEEYDKLSEEQRFNFYRMVKPSIISDETIKEYSSKEFNELDKTSQGAALEYYIDNGNSFNIKVTKLPDETLNNTSKDDTINNNEEVQEDERTNTRATKPNTETKQENRESGVSAAKQKTSGPNRAEQSTGKLRDGHKADDTNNNVSRSDYGISAEDERVDGYRTNEANQLDNRQPADEYTVLPEPTRTDNNELTNYDLRDKEPISLTRGQRKEANKQVLEIIKKPVEQITQADKEILRLHTGDGGLDDVTEGSFNQHFTNYKTIQSIYDALDNAGVVYEKILEPAVGSGNFIGFAPDKKWDIVDIDTTNIEVAKRLYPNVRQIHNETFETFKGKNYDLVISNVPFASAQALTREYVMSVKPQFKAIHNFYFAQAIDKVKDNGVVAFMTSTSTMDGQKEAMKLREYLVSKADIIGAFRLPENSQRENAHTDTMIDIIFLQKRPEGIKSRQEKLNENFVNLATKKIEGKEFKINKYLLEKRSYLGKLEVGRDRTKMGKEGLIVTGEPRYSDMRLNYEPYETKKAKEQSSNSFETYDDFIKYADKNNIIFSLKNKANDFTIENGEAIIYKDKVDFTDSDANVIVGKKTNSTNAKKLLLLDSVMQYAEEYVSTQNENAKQRALNEIESYKEVYKKAPHSDASLKKFTKEHNADKLYKELISYFDKDFTPAKLFNEKVRFENSGKIEVSKNDPLDIRALSEEDANGLIDMEYSLNKSKLIKKNEVKKLLDTNQYAVVEKNKIQNAYQYYAGNIYSKIDKLNAMYATDEIAKEQYEKQLTKLKEILPPETAWKDIRFKGIESWFPKSVQEKFITKLEGEYKPKADTLSKDRYYEIYSNHLNNRQLVKRDQKNETQDEHRQRLLEANKILQEEIIPEIKTLIEKQGDTEKVAKAYNRASSFYVAPKLTGQLLKKMPTQFRGKPFKMQSHQLEGAELVVYNKKGVIAFAPGGGKTITAIVSVENLRQQGVMKKPLFVVPVNTIHQWEETVRELYPDASVFEFPKIKSGKNKGQAKEWSQLIKDEKEQIVYDLTNNRYDYTIIGDTAFQKIGIPQEKIEQYANELVDSITQMEEDAEENSNSRKKKKDGISKEAKKRALVRGVVDQYKGDVTVDIEKLGFDAIIADEVQYYKNIGMQGSDVRGNLGGSVSVTYSKNGEKLTQKDIAAGVEPDQAKLGSWRAYDFRFKTRYISEKNNGNNIILLTGTPTPNKPLELMTLLHHLDVNILKEYGIDNVSDFVATFFETADFETVDGQGKPKTEQGLASIRNTQWLKKIITRFVNYKGFEDMPDLPRPKQVDIQHYLSLSPAGEEVFADIKHRLIKAIEDSKKVGMPSDAKEQTITMYGAGRDASIDLRLYNVGHKNKSNYTQEEINELIDNDSITTLNNKVEKVVELVSKQFKANPQSGQIIFNDRIKYKDKDGNEKSIHEEIKQKIMSTGLFEPNEVVIVTGQQYTNPDTGNDLKLGTSIKNSMLQNIMNKYNAGKIKVIIGNTAKLGVGVDLNRYTTDIYQMDIPFRPDEIEQRNNRGVRQGNINKEVRVHSFFQIGTFDQFSFNLIKKKEGFNNVFWKATDNEYSVIDKGSELDPYEMVIQVEPDVFKREKLRLERIIDKGDFELRDIQKKIDKYKSEVEVKTTLIDGDMGYKKRIERLEEDLKPKNFPKYESIKDEEEKTKKLEEYVQRTKDKIKRDKQRIIDTQDEIEQTQELIKQTKEKLAMKKAQIQMVSENFTQNDRVSLELIKDEYTAEQLLRKEGKDEKQIEEYLKNKDNISYSRSNTDDAMPNNPQKLTGSKRQRPDSGTITLRDKELKLGDKFNPTTPASIRKLVVSTIGNRLYFSKIRQKADGFYKKITGETRIKDINNVEVYAHELAHYLDFYNGNKTFSKAYQNREFKDEIKSFSYTSKKEHILKEGFAEYIRAWLTQYEFAKEKAPKFTQEFETLLKMDSKLEKNMNKIQEEMHKWYNQGDEAMFSALIGDKKTRLDSLKETVFNIKQNIANRTLVNFFDRTHGFSVAEFSMFGKLNKGEQSATKLLRIALGGSASTYEAVIKWGTPRLTPKGEIAFDGNKGLADIFEPALKKGSEEFKQLMEYFAAVQAKEMKAQGKQTPFSDSMIEAVITRTEKDQSYFKDIFNEYQEFNNRMLDFYVDMNYLRPSDVENFKEKNQVYVPMQRVVESMGQKDGNVSSSFKSRKGSDRNIRDIEVNITEQLYYHIRGAMIANAKNKLFTQLNNHEDGSLFAVRLASNTKKVQVHIEQQAEKMVQFLYDGGLMVDEFGDIVEIQDNASFEEVLDNTIDTLITKPQLMSFMSFGHKPKNTGSHIEEVIINGKTQYYEVQTGELGDILNTTLNSLGGVQYGKFLGALYWLKNFKTRAITAMPQFKLPNFARDTMDALVYRRTKKILNPFAGAKSYLTLNDAYKNYMLNGGGYGTLIESTTHSNPLDIFEESIAQKFDRIMSIDEYSNRLNSAETSIKEGESWVEATYRGRDLTVDFSMVGANPVLRHILKLLPFQQAGMNGMYKLVREIKDEGNSPKTYAKAVGRLSAKGLAYLTPIAMIAFMINNDDERYKALTADEMARFVWFFYDKDEQPLKLPVPFGLGAIFQKFPEYIMSALFSDGDFVDNRYSEAVKFAVVNQLVAVPNGGIFDPFIQDMKNEKFTGAKIVSDRLAKVESYLQYNSRTPLFYKELGAATGLSPVKLEHYTKGALGYIENAITGMTQMALWDKENWGDMPYSSVEDKVHAVFFKQFYKNKDTARSAWSEEYYEYRTKIDEAYSSINFTNRQIMRDKGDSYLEYMSKEDKVKLASLKKFTNNIDKISAEVSTMEEAIYFDKSLSAKQKEQKIEELYKNKTKVMKEAYKAINKTIKGE